MSTMLHVLSIGFSESSNIVRDALLERRGFRLVAAAGIWDLYSITHQSDIDIAILHHSLTRSELRNCTEYIRRHWPGTRILLISAETVVLDDPLYDDKAPPGLSPMALLAFIERLTGRGKKEPRTDRGLSTLAPSNSNMGRL